MKMIAWILWWNFCNANVKQKMFAVAVCTTKQGRKFMTEEKKEEIAVIEITEEYMKDRLYEFRGKKSYD